MLLGAEGGTDLVNPVEATRHQHLLVELRRLRQVRFAVEILYREERGTPLSGRCNNLRRLHFQEAFAPQVVVHRARNSGADAEEGRDFGAPQVEIACVESRLYFTLDAVNDTER